MSFWSIFGANHLARRNTTFARYLNQAMNSCFINPECHIPKSINLTHGQVVIGKATIGKNVTLFQNVTLGARGTDDAELTHKDFPVIEDNVTIYANCVIIGNVTIGRNSIIGAGSFINKDVPANTIAYSKKEIIMKKNDNKER